MAAVVDLNVVEARTRRPRRNSTSVDTGVVKITMAQATRPVLYVVGGNSGGNRPSRFGQTRNAN